MPQELGRSLIVFGAILLVVGLALAFSDRIPWLGRLPGDIVVRKGNFTLYAPLVTGLVLSLVLTLLLNLWSRR
jgi:Zn-dependent protease with chaperone function